MTPQRQPWLITRLFDLTFSRFVALTLVRFVYVVLMIAGLVFFAVTITYLFQIGQRETTLAAIALLIVSPIVYLVYLLVIRVVCETLLVLFAIAEDLEEIRAALAKRDGAEPPTGD